MEVSCVKCFHVSCLNFRCETLIFSCLQFFHFVSTCSCFKVLHSSFFWENIQTTLLFVGCFMTYKTKPNHQELVMERANLEKKSGATPSAAWGFPLPRKDEP